MPRAEINGFYLPLVELTSQTMGVSFKGKSPGEHPTRLGRGNRLFSKEKYGYPLILYNTFICSFSFAIDCVDRYFNRLLLDEYNFGNK